MIICYTKVPREIIDTKDLSPRAKVIYEYFLSLFELSKKHPDQFQDERGIYICCPREKLMDKFNCAKGTVIKAIKELKQYGFIEEVRQGQGKVNKIYIKDLFLGSEKSKKETSRSSKSDSSKSTKSELQEVQKMTPINTNDSNTLNLNKTYHSINTTTTINNNTIAMSCCDTYEVNEPTVSHQSSDNHQTEDTWHDPYYCHIVKRLEKYDLSRLMPNYETYTDADKAFMIEQLMDYFRDKTTENLNIWFAHYTHFMECGLIWLACEDIKREHESWEEARILLDTLLYMGIDTLNKWRRYIGLPEVKENETLIEKLCRIFTERFNKKPNRVITEYLQSLLDYSMEYDVILDAFDIALNKNKEWDYAQGVLNNRLRNGIMTINDIVFNDRVYGMI